MSEPLQDKTQSSGSLHPACSGLLAELKRHRAQMAPHHKDREAGRLLLRSITALEEMDKKVSLLCEEWADDHTHLQKLCRKHGCTEDEVEGSSYGVPGIMELADLLDAKLSQNAGGMAAGADGPPMPDKEKP